MRGGSVPPLLQGDYNLRRKHFSIKLILNHNKSCLLGRLVNNMFFKIVINKKFDTIISLKTFVNKSA